MTNNRIGRYPGGKYRQQPLLQSYFPLDYKSFYEPFTGGGVFFGIEPNKKMWINDLNAGLIALYTALRDRPKQFIELCQSIPPAQPGEEQVFAKTGTPYNKRLRDKFYELRDDPQADLALRYFFLNRCSYAGRVVLERNRINRTMFSNPNGWNIVATDRLVQAAKHLQGVQITCDDFEPLFTTPGDGVLVYADPPYVRDTELPLSSKLYQHGFTMDDHRRLAEVIHRCPHKVCLSYDDHPFIRELYRDLFIHEASWKYCGSSRKEKVDGKELLITNYAILAQKSQPANDLCFSAEDMMPTTPLVMASSTGMTPTFR